LRATILPQLRTAITTHWHQRVDILMPNYYDPFQNFCPNTVSYIRTLNHHLAADIAGYGRIVDIFTLFGGATVPNPNVCTLTWICSTYTDIHPTTAGYQLIANAAYKKLFSY
jgi:lysophospholipase L1-like esterase